MGKFTKHDLCSHNLENYGKIKKKKFSSQIFNFDNQHLLLFKICVAAISDFISIFFRKFPLIP